jgi:AraC-like DNA-binding protein
VGFADQSHMGRHFKQIVGVSPARYIAMLKDSESRASLLSHIARTF